jgi:hypothetical protein
MKYKTSDEVFNALDGGQLKRSSALACKSRAKSKGDMIMFNIYAEGISKFDSHKSTLVCSYYNKPIDHLTAYQLVKLYDYDPRLFTNNHLIRYNILMIGDDDNTLVKDYKGSILVHVYDMDRDIE